jgi:nucleoside-diphosphate-sugar epimerase
MKYLLTGATGFLGKIIFNHLSEESNNSIITLGRGDFNNIICDLSKDVPSINESFDTVIHCAGKAHSIPRTLLEEQVFFDVNYIGTKNLLKSLENKLPKTIVFISTVAVYGKDFGEMIDESFPLLGNTPYAKSKILAEEEVVKFSQKHNINYIILRLPLISGISPPGNLDSMMKTIKKGYYFRIGKGLAKKSIVSAKDVATLIPKLHDKCGIFNLTDGVNPTFKEIENHIGSIYNKKIVAIPKFIFKLLALIGDVVPGFILNTIKLDKITKSLTFSDTKAIKELNWQPNSALNEIKSKT